MSGALCESPGLFCFDPAWFSAWSAEASPGRCGSVLSQRPSGPSRFLELFHCLAFFFPVLPPSEIWPPSPLFSEPYFALPGFSASALWFRTCLWKEVWGTPGVYLTVLSWLPSNVGKWWFHIFRPVFMVVYGKRISPTFCFHFVISEKMGIFFTAVICGYDGCVIYSPNLDCFESKR